MNNNILALSFFALLLLTSCGGSGQEDSFNQNGSASPPASSQLNSGFQGSLFYALSGTGGAARMDIESGEVTIIEKTLGWENNYKDIASVRVEPVRFEKSEMVLTVNSCGDDLAGDSSYTS